MSSSLPQLVVDRLALDSLLDKLPLLPCAHCGRHGNLIGHGFLRGYSERSNIRLLRGRRIFCSNRGRRRGCGRTVSTLLSRFIERYVVTAATLWALFCRLADGLPVERAARETDFPQTQRSAYRCAASLKRQSFSWRSWLCTRQVAPPTTSVYPLQQLRAHLTAELGDAPFEQPEFRKNSTLL